MMKTSEINQRGCKELLFHRMLMAVFSSIIVQFIFMSIAILLTHLSFKSPSSWIQDTLSVITCCRMWTYFIILASVIILQGIVCSKNYLNAPGYFVESRFAMFFNLFTPHNFLVGGLYLLIGIILVWLHLSMEDSDFSSLYTNCKTHSGYCLVEEHLYLLLSGIWSGIYYFTKINTFNLQNLQFPIIPQSKLSQIKRGICSSLPNSLTSAIWPCLYFMNFYFFFGSYLREAATTTFFITNEREPLDKVWRLLNLSLILHSWLYASLFNLTLNSMYLLFQVYLTEWMPFPITQSVYDNQTNITLPEALAISKVPIIQHLGYLDLFTLAQKEKHRRAELFTLSQPGGHPYSWNSVLEKCLSIIQDFSKEINNACSLIQNAALCLPSSLINQDKSPESNKIYKMRNLATLGQSPINQPEVATDQKGFSIKNMMTEFLKAKKQNFINYLLSKPLIFYFFGVNTDSKVRYLLLKGQSINWASDAISTLAVVSIDEDPYGIVQKDLPDIIKSLLTLKQSLDKLYKLNLLSKKVQSDDKEMKQMLTSIRTANRRSLYRIVTSFKNYFDDIPLDQTVKDQLMTFFVYRE